MRLIERTLTEEQRLDLIDFIDASEDFACTVFYKEGRETRATVYVKGLNNPKCNRCRRNGCDEKIRSIGFIGHSYSEINMGVEILEPYRKKQRELANQFMEQQ